MHHVTIAFLRKRFKFFDILRESKSILAGFVNFNIDFWITIPPLIVSLALDIETNVKLFMALLLFGLSLLALSILMDGKNAIVVPFW